MRHMFFFLLCLTQFLPATWSQDNRREAMDRLQPQINKRILRQLPAFLRKGDSSREVSERGFNAELLLDSTLTYLFEFGSGQDSSLHLRTVVEYLQPGQKIEWDSYYDGLTWQPLQYTTFFVDAEGRLLEALAMIYDPVLAAYVPDSRLLAWPHGQSAQDLDSFFLLQWNPDVQGWELALEHHYTYDQQDRLVEEWSSFQFFGEILIFRDVHAYDAAGDLVLTEHFAEFDGFEFMAARTEISYVNHRPTQRVSKTFNGLEFQYDSREIFAYDNLGYLMVQRDYTWDPDNGGWLLIIEARYDYDTQGRIASRETVEVFDEFTFEERLTYEYETDEQLAVETRYTRLDAWSEWVPDVRTYYFYQGTSSLPVTPLPVLPLTVWPNPVSQLVTIRLEEPADVTLLDALGRRVRSVQASGDVQLDLHGLLAGIYQVLARSGERWYQERLIKR